MNNRDKKIKCLALVSAVLVLLAMLLGLISSGKAYAFQTRLLIISCVAAALMDVACALLLEKLPGICTDIAFAASTALTAWALSIVILARVTLVGYIYFSDLESSNPVALSAMNFAWAAAASLLAALVINFIIGFSRHTKD